MDSSGDSPVFSLFYDELDRELQRPDEEMDQFVKFSNLTEKCWLGLGKMGERMRQAILEKVQASQFQILSIGEEKILQKLGEKESEVEDINKKNTELEEKMK
ncbi:hypothetical protein HHK36_009903 [Tetracentron sinense]|uniref:Uncharacterized protein n=1 Tax=Tetracentron sinense TaxID=13715 RepID=A0A834ZGY1_TETSI|nr:hypothetical protein HHK36_009903 [Tetracentron sinense]